MKHFDGVLSWIGVLIILGAYILNVFGLVETKSVIYLLANVVGSVFILGHAFHRRDYQPAILNIIWAAVALINLVILL
jgi:hypothetical protein